MALFEDIGQQKSFVYLKEVETVAQDILTLKEEKLELSNIGNKYREALRALESVTERFSWIKIGSLYVERSTDDCRTILRKELLKTEEDLKNLHEEIKIKVYKLRDLEQEPRIERFSLKPISLIEAKALNKAFGI